MNLRYETRRVVARMLRLIVVAAVIAAPLAHAADTASGAIVLGKHQVRIAHVVMVRGPDEMDESRSVLRVYFSPDDPAAKIKACKTLSCADQVLGDGASVDYADMPHLGYWVRLNGGRVQNSGGTAPDSFALTANTSDHLAGQLHVDATSMGGPRIDAEFDAALAVTFERVR